jgi:hypothetical protein
MFTMVKVRGHREVMRPRERRIVKKLAMRKEGRKERTEHLAPLAV